MATSKNGIDAYKDRFSSPVGIRLTNPKTRKPIKSGKKTVKKGKK